MNDGRQWQALNAYADGELQGEARRRLEAALAEDPRLQETLRRIRTMKQGLASAQPQCRARQTPRWKVAAVAAACLAVVITAALALVPVTRKAPWQAQVAAAHAALSQETFVVEPERPLPVVSSQRLNDFTVPDLRASRLYLVATRTEKRESAERLIMHYRGLNGCSLSIAALAPLSAEPATDDWAPASGHLFAGWRAETLGFAVIADGMDAARFQAIADYVKAAIDERLKPKDQLRTAMAESYRAARPCA